jgi:hypothetical protein
VSCACNALRSSVTDPLPNTAVHISEGEYCRGVVVAYKGSQPRAPGVVRSAHAPNQGRLCAWTPPRRPSPRCSGYADRHHAPASFVAMLWHLRAEPPAVQANRLHQLWAAMHEGHRAALRRGNSTPGRYGTRVACGPHFSPQKEIVSAGHTRLLTWLPGQESNLRR